MKIPIYLKTYNSPFKPLQLRWYFGKIAQGVPYFLPRKWVKYTKEDCNREACIAIVKNKVIKKTVEEWEKYFENYSKAIPIKFGFSSCGLGWKTKYDSYRFEYAPRWSFVAFGYQLCLTFYVENEDHYWESFLAYHYETYKSLSWQERIKISKEKYPQIWTTHYGSGEEETTDYWAKILKPKYL